MRIFLMGGTGLVGSRLVRRLFDRNDQIVLLTRRPKAAHAAEAAGGRVVIVRVGVVLDKEGGALKEMMRPFKLFAGGPVGSGKQWLSWIHHEDMVGLLLLALDNAQASGPLNGTAPQP